VNGLNWNGPVLTSRTSSIYLRRPVVITASGYNVALNYHDNLVLKITFQQH